MKKNILVVDDDTRILVLFERILSKQGYDVATCTQGSEAIEYIEAHNCDLVLCDLSLVKMDGIQLMLLARRYSPKTPFVIITGYDSVSKAVEAVKKGAFDYIVKPFENETILRVIQRALKELPVSKASEVSEFSNIIGQSEKMQRLLGLITQIAATSATILIQGESGTGKELIASAIHRKSLRKSQPFIPVNCGTLSDNLLENELFGHVQGAFTGAVRYKKGLLVEADKGTLFLDEVSETPLAVQTKLLRVLQEKEFKPLGSTEIIHVDVRVITATNLDLKQAVQERRFREDLYYRLAVIPLQLPPLRERREDIPLLADHFVKKYAQENNREIDYIDPDALESLRLHAWPGNVRELENTIARAVVLATNRVITSDILWQSDTKGSASQDANPDSKPLKGMLNQQTKSAILKALELSQGNRSQAARLLGISRASLYNKIKKYQLTGGS